MQKMCVIVLINIFVIFNAQMIRVSVIKKKINEYLDAVYHSPSVYAIKSGMEKFNSNEMFRS